VPVTGHNGHRSASDRLAGFARWQRRGLAARKVVALPTPSVATAPASPTAAPPAPLHGRRRVGVVRDRSCTALAVPRCRRPRTGAGSSATGSEAASAFRRGRRYRDDACRASLRALRVRRRACFRRFGRRDFLGRATAPHRAAAAEPVLDVRAKPKSRPTDAKADYWPRHVGVAVLVPAHAVAVRQA
jgi:hypothetical protein